MNTEGFKLGKLINMEFNVFNIINFITRAIFSQQNHRTVFTTIFTFYAAFI